ncbi:type II secretion system protein [Thalassotalea crassostreae]|uniref:type II secretion system protein n=1 Tax=Thalassotalea crassostreae TaxID=1763536 RepID=UPI00083931F6|nr:type II secretion system protein [Thalassotalea crassostreae]
MKVNISSVGKTSGVTLIELVVVILIVTILAVTVAPRFIGVSSFDAYVYRDQMISSLRLIQQQAMQQTDANSCHQILLTNQGYGQSNNCSVPSLVPDWDSNNLGFAIPADSTVTIRSLSTNTFTFNSLGTAEECTGFGSRICIIEFANGNDSASICIEAQGYIHDC